MDSHYKSDIFIQTVFSLLKSSALVPVYTFVNSYSFNLALAKRYSHYDVN